MHNGQHRFASRFRIAVGDSNRNLLVTTSDHFRKAIAAVVYHRIMQRTESGARIESRVLHLVKLEDINDEI